MLIRAFFAHGGTCIGFVCAGACAFRFAELCAALTIIEFRRSSDDAGDGDGDGGAVVATCTEKIAVAVVSLLVSLLE